MNDARIGRRFFLKGTAGAVAGLAVGSALTTGNVFAADAKAAQGKDWTPLFNGKDLSGWKTEGNAKWAVENGAIVGVQGPNGAAGDLFTEKEYDDFEVRIVYKLQWPANSGVWFRYQSPDKSYQADILEYKKPEAYSGTIYCPGKMFLSINSDPKLEKKDDWNTIEILAKGDHLVVKLNGVVTGDVHESSYAKGRIGFQIHPGDDFNSMKLSVKEAVVRPA